MLPESSDVTVLKGNILVYRVFDVADEVNLLMVERILKSVSAKSRLSLAKRLRQALIIRDAPVRLSLGDTTVKVGAENLRAEMFATVWNYGVLSIMFQIPIQRGTDWRTLVRYAEILLSGSEDNAAIDANALQKSRELTALLAPALQRSAERHMFEDYVIFYFEELSGIKNAAELMSKADLPALILGEPRENLSEKTRQSIIEGSFQYATNDLVVIDWNSAIVLEPTGLRETTDVLEFALTHLLEFRYYDDLLDTRLLDLYQTIELGRRGIWRSSFARISREANTRFMEFSEFIERVGNSLKVVGDFYLAGIFRASVRRFRIPDWQQSVTQKLNLLARVSELLQGEVNVTRGHTLEIIIVVLIIFEIISAIVRSV